MTYHYLRGWRARSTVAAALLGCLGLAACGSSSHSSSGSTTTGASASSTTASSSGSTAATSAPTSVSSATGTGLPAHIGTITGPGVTPTEIKVGTIATVSGPVPGIFKSSADSMDAYAAYVNSLGGIDGKKLVVVHKDDAYNCNTYTNALKSMVGQVFAMVGTFSVEDGCGQSVLKANPNLPDIEADIINPTLFSSPNAFAAVSQPPGYLTTGYLWLKGKYPKAITHAARLYPTSAALSANAQYKVAEMNGYKYVYARGIGNTETNFTSDILRMKSEGIQMVDLLSDPVTVAADFEQQAAQQNFHPVAVISATAYDANFFKLLGNPADAANLIAPEFFPMYLGQDSATNPELATYLSWLKKIHPATQSDLFGTTSWGAGVLFTQALAAAGSSVTQAGVVQAITNLGSFTGNGLLPPTNPGKRVGPNCQVIVGVKNGAYVRLDPPDKGYVCNGQWINIPLSQLSS